MSRPPAYWGPDQQRCLPRLIFPSLRTSAPHDGSSDSSLAVMRIASWLEDCSHFKAENSVRGDNSVPLFRPVWFTCCKMCQQIQRVCCVVLALVFRQRPGHRIQTPNSKSMEIQDLEARVSFHRAWGLLAVQIQAGIWDSWRKGQMKGRSSPWASLNITADPSCCFIIQN